jgi:hypothetical protein
MKTKVHANRAVPHNQALALTAHPQVDVATPNGFETEAEQRLRWSSGWWSPPAESNRRPHPYHGTTGNRCAEPRFPRSRPTVEAEVIGSIDVQVCVLLAS